jgi:type IV secretory pathway VirB10-like protein
MSKRIFALVGLFVTLTTTTAVAQEQPTYEGRGYGGPLGVGPNFQQGGQWGPPVYGQGQSHGVERYSAPQHVDRVQRKRNTDDDVKTAKKTPAPQESKEASKEAKAQSENSSIVTIGSDTDKSTPVTEQKKTDLAKSDKSKSSNENSTIASVASSATANADPVKGQLSKRVDSDASGKTVATCKRYFPTVGQTITVPCD